VTRRSKCATAGGSRCTMVYHSCLRSSPAIRSMLGEPLVTYQTPSVPASCFTTPFGRRCNPDGPCTAKLTAAWPSSVPASERSTRLAKRQPTRRYCDRITRPICTLGLPIPTPDLGNPFSLRSSRFPCRKARSIKGVEACKKRSMA
jgi:hypothetical protein